METATSVCHSPVIPRQVYSEKASWGSSQEVKSSGQGFNDWCARHVCKCCCSVAQVGTKGKTVNLKAIPRWTWVKYLLWHLHQAVQGKSLLRLVLAYPLKAASCTLFPEIRQHSPQ